MNPPSLARAGLLNFAETGITLASALIVSVLLARSFGPARFGLYALVMSVVTFALILAKLGISTTVRRYIAELDGRRDAEGTAMMVGHGIRLGLASGTAGMLLLAGAAVPLAAFFRHPVLRDYLLIGAPMVLLMVLVGVLNNIVSGFQQYRYLVRLSLVTSPLWIVGCAVAVRTGAGVAGVLVATLVIELINFAGLSWWVIQRTGIRWRVRLPAELRSRVFQYNLALGVLIVLDAIVWERSEIVFLGRFQPAQQVSFYAVPFALTERVTDLIPGAILGVLLPGLAFVKASTDPERFRAVFRQGLRYLTLLTLPICLLGIPLAPFIIGLLYGPGFEPASIVLQILLISVLFGVLGQAARSALLAMESQAFLVKTGLCAAALSIGLDLLLIPGWGAVGAAVANLTVQAAWSLTIFVPLSRRLRLTQAAPVPEAVASS